MPPLELREVFREYLRRQVKALAAGSQNALANKTGIPDGDISKALSAKDRRGATLGHMMKIATAYDIPTSRLLADLARIAFEMEMAATVPLPPHVAALSAADPEFARTVNEEMRADEQDTLDEAPANDAERTE